MQGVLIDLDGVIYERGKEVAGAADTLGWLERNRIPHLFLTNTTSKPRSAIVEKLGGFGIRTSEEKILTPPVAALTWLRRHVSGPIALFVPDATAAEFASIEVAMRSADDSSTAVAAVVIGDYGERWSFAEMNRAFRLLMADPQPALVALGMTRYWLADDGLRLDTGTFATALSFATGLEPVVVGKPGKAFFAAALDMLRLPAEATVMIGDDLLADVGGAQAAGLSGVLVRTGKYRPGDEEAEIRPTTTLDSIAELPRWFASLEA